MAQVPGTFVYSQQGTSKPAVFRLFAFNFKTMRNTAIVPRVDDVRAGTHYADGARPLIGTYTPPAGGGGGSYWS